MSNTNVNKQDNGFKPKQLSLASFDLDKSSMIEASAGTGKTFTISNLVVRLLIEGIKKGNSSEPLDIENILIVTFTNAAASDLRARVLQKIHECRISFDQIKNGDKTIEELEKTFKEVAIHCFEKYSHNTIDGISIDNIKNVASVFSRLLTRAERNIDRASISTIHSFCNKALNQIYSFEAGRAFNVNLTQDISLEQKEAKLTVWRSLFYNDNGFDRDLLLNLLGFTDPENDTLKKAVKALEKVRLIDPDEGYYGFSVKSYYEEGVKKLQKTPDDRIRYLLDEYVKSVFQLTQYLEPLKEYKGQLISTSSAGEIAHGALYELSSGQLAGSAPYWAKKTGLIFLEAVDSFIKEDSIDINNFISKLENIDAETLSKILNQDNSHFVKVNKGSEFANQQQLETFEYSAKEFARAYLDVLRTVDTIKNELKISVAIKVILKTDELCERDNVISNDEVLRQLAVALNNKDESRGDVLASLLRKRYPVAMIDEFQDTDPVQFAIFSKLYLDQDVIDESAHCYLIGDPKQSIYAFRGTDINSYNKAKELILENKGNVYTLNTNFRSCQKIIEGVNEIFEEYEDPKNQESAEDSSANKENIESQNSADSLPEKKDHTAYQYVEHPFDYYKNSEEKHLDSKIQFERVNCSDKPNSVRFYFKDDSSKEIPICNYIREVSFADSQEKPKANDYYGEIAKFVALDVKRCLLEGKIFEKGEERDVKPSDITILVNDAKENRFIQDALKKLSIQSVYFSDRESVLNSEKNDKITASEEATNIIYLMEAMCDNTNSPKVNRLLGSSLLRLSSEKFLDSIKSDKLDTEITLLRACRESWEKYGFITAFSQYIYQHDLLCTILETDGGERSLSNYFQIAEIVQSVNSKVVGSNAQLLWFKELVLNNKGELSEDITKKHLESEQSLVKVMTIHKSKGLEFPIVFTPYESGFMALKSKDSAVYYDPDSKKVSYALDRDNKIKGKSVKDLVEVAALQEQERLLYVALTRAKLANFISLPSCISLNGKTYQSPLKKLISIVSKDDSADSKGKPSKRATKKSKDKEVGIDTTKDVVVNDPPKTQLKAVENPDLFKKLETVELDECVELQNSISQEGEVSSLDKGSVDNSFTVTSYSAITSGAHNDMFASSVDEKETSVEDGDSDDSKDKDLINFNFAKGSTAGSFLHKIMEIVLAKDDVDKTDKDSLYNFVNSQLKYDFYHLVSKSGDDEDAKNEKIVALSSWLYDILNANLLPKAKDGDQVKLSNLKALDCARELDYFLPCKDFKVRVLNGICHDFYESEVKAFEMLSVPELPDLKKSNFKGYMNGSLDLVAKFDTETGPKFYMIDYKSNYLGNSFSQYTQQKILKSIFESRYDVQILFYSLALYRFLKTTLPNFSYEKDFGGVMYLYLRGMNSFDTKSPGQFYVKPSEALIDRLDRLFKGINDRTANNSDAGEE